MTRQVAIFDKDTYQLIEFIEYHNNELIIHEKYNKDEVLIYELKNNKIYEHIKHLSPYINSGDLVYILSDPLRKLHLVKFIVQHVLDETGKRTEVFNGEERYVIVEYPDDRIRLSKKYGFNEIKLAYKLIITRVTH